MTSLVASALDQARGLVGAFAWGPAVSVSRNMVLALLSRIQRGRLIILENDGTTTICGQTSSDPVEPNVHLRVVREAFWLRLALFADMVRIVTVLWCVETKSQDRVSPNLSCWAKFNARI